MAKIPEVIDPTLAAVDAALKKIAETEQYDAAYLGVSYVGRPCLRQSWYRFRWATQGVDEAPSLRRLEDGRRCEKAMAEQLRYVHALTLQTTCPDDKRQFAVLFLGGHLRGRVDGLIKGLLQAPSTAHVWEHKSTKEAEFKKLAKLKREKGEKAALAAWNEVYRAAATLYLEGLGMSRHYLTVSTPGLREVQSVRSDADPAEAARLLKIAEAIVFADRAPPRLSQDPDYFECRWCPALAVCHGNDLGRSHCRSCMHSTAEQDGTWSCARWNKTLPLADQHQGCPAHLYSPDMVPGEIVAANDAEEWVEYRLRNGMVWKDGRG